MYIATDSSTNKVIARMNRYGFLLGYIMSLGYIDPDSYVINWKDY